MTDTVDLRPVQALVFDYYGTIVDMQAGLTEAIRPFLTEKGYAGEPGRVVTWWRRTHFEDSMIDALLHREHTPYREVGRRAVSVTLERARIPFTDEEVRWLVAQIERLRPFADVGAKGRELAAPNGAAWPRRRGQAARGSARPVL
jgi:2-haloacid dehalogenase